MPVDPTYQTFGPGDFPAMLEPACYARRSSRLEEIIAGTEEYFWNPEVADYIRFDTPWPAGAPGRTTRPGRSRRYGHSRNAA